MPTSDETRGRIRTILRTDFAVDGPLADDATFYVKDGGADVGDIDSLDFVEFVMMLEEEFHVEIPDSDCPPLVTIDATAEYLDRRLANG